MQVIGTSFLVAMLALPAQAANDHGAAGDPIGATIDAANAWKQDWELADGFAIDIDTGGFRFPTSIAFVPKPGPGPKDPLYFVTELRGALKVVTNDRTVHTFAEDFFRLDLDTELPDMRAEIGLGAVALDPVHGYVFASFGYHDEGGYLHNDIIRFETTPGTFSLAPSTTKRFVDPFAAFPSSRSHQIGHMVVEGDTLYVAVGDALQSAAGRDLSSVLGKVLRLTLDGRPAPGNPFSKKTANVATRHAPSDYVWAYGLRNPFGLVRAGTKLYAAENGPSVDRFVHIERGKSYGYDGTDWSMGTHALAVFAPSVGPAQTAWLSEGSKIFPTRFAGAFYMAFGGSLLTVPGSGPRGERSIVYMPFDLASDSVREPPQPLARYRGNELQMPVGLAFGPDALYVAPLFPVRGGTSAILRIVHDPARGHPYRIDRDASPAQLLTTYGCHGCHASYENRASIGPSLDPPGLVSRVHAHISSPAYAEEVEAIDALTEEPFVSYRDERRAVLDARGKEKIRLWLTYRMLEPSFDTTSSMMPKQGLSFADAERLAEYFVDSGWGKADVAPEEPRPLDRLKALLPPPRHRHVAVALAAGLIVGLWLARRRRPS